MITRDLGKRPRSIPRPLFAALLACGLGVSSLETSAVRLNADGHGQALIYPYYTVRSTSGNEFVSLLTVTNGTPGPKAVKARFHEGKSGTEVMDFNLFLSAYDVWTGALVQSGSGAGLFTNDRSCTVPAISRNASSLTLFRNGAYAGDGYGDGLDRTMEGYFEILEMGAIDPNGSLAFSVTHVPDFSAPNASRPPCTNLPQTDAVHADLRKPTGGLMGTVSYINVNEGTDYSVDAIALTQWSDKVQWSAVGNAYPDLSDANPAISVVVHDSANSELLIRSEWTSGRDAVSAVLMADRLSNDYSAEPSIRSATDWVMTLPTLRHHVSGAQFQAPFLGNSIGTPRSEVVGMQYFDREGQSPVPPLCLVPGPPCDQLLPFASTVLSWPTNREDPNSATVLGSHNGSRLSTTELPSTWINGWAEMALGDGSARVLVAPAGKSTVTRTATGTVTTAGAVTYHGLPVVGFAVQAYRTSGLPGLNPNVLSNYGGNFNHRVLRRIEIVPPPTP